MFKMSLKVSAAILSLVSLSNFAHAEKTPKQSDDFKANVELAIKDNKANQQTALCTATAHDLTKNPNYRYDRFGFTQDDFDNVKLRRFGDSGLKHVIITGEARVRSGKEIKWDNITVKCAVDKNSVRYISVCLKKLIQKACF